MARVVAWGLVPAALAVFAAALVARTSEAKLELARERLLAGRPAEARRALHAVLWPGLGARAAGALSLATALDGGKAPAAAAFDPQAIDPEAVLVGALERGDVGGALRTARLLREAGHPLGALYAAALAFDAGAEEDARRSAAQSAVPLASRGPGQRLAVALAARAAGARTLLWDRGGRLVATIDWQGRPALTAEAAGLLDQPLARLADGADLLPREAGAVRLSLDADTARAAFFALGPHRGSIVLLDLRTGALLAAVSDAVTAAAEPDAAFAQRREPASIAKLLTTAAAYRAGHDADAAIKRMTCGGVERYGGKPLWCSFPAGPLEGGLDQALGISCNIAFANLGMLVGPERLVAEYRLWGFDGGPTSLLGAAGRILAEPRDPRALADLAIGLERVDVTPLHAAVLAAVVGGGGRFRPPRLVAGAASGLALREPARPLPPAREVLPAEVAARLRAAMQAVARGGTGAGLAPEGFPIAMKTGTAETPRLGYHVNYVGFAPLSEPAIAFCVRVTGEGSSPGVTRAARDVTRRLLEALAARAPRFAADAQRTPPSPR